MYTNFPFQVLITSIRSNDVAGVKFLLNKRGLLVGPEGVIDLDMDHGVYRAVVENGNQRIVDLVVNNDKRVIPHLLNYASKCGKLDLITYILQEYSTMITQLDIDNILRYASIKCYINIIEYSLKLGANINEICNSAAYGGHVELLLWAIDNGANLPNNNCLSVGLYHAIQKNDEISTHRLYNMCTDPLQHCLNEDNLDVMLKIIQIKEVDFVTLLKKSVKVESKRIFTHLSLICGNSKL